ncbi:hypothetical protein U9M48_024714 [Paspalum notatum var. saurae]|uniref:Uncharacterized protein n=1 Tax=Paspalum notatum var. saurae TaxID=547442 RepID=A0AAQ3TPC9_PASNO
MRRCSNGPVPKIAQRSFIRGIHHQSSMLLLGLLPIAREHNPTFMACRS